MSRQLASRIGAGLAVAVIVGLQALAPTDAQADDYRQWNCNYNQPWYGSSGATWGQTKSSYCQTKYLSLTYKLYAGSPTYTSGWYYSETAIYRTAPIMLYATHRVRSCVYPYDCGPLRTYP